MGNRAVLILESMPTVGIYLHWNGGLESVLAFLEAAKRRGVRDPSSDGTYCLARLTQTIGEYFSAPGEYPDYECSLGVGPVSDLDCDNGNNGVYWIGKGFTITRREHARDTRTTVQALDRVGPRKRNGGDERYPSELQRYEAIVAELDTLTNRKPERN